MYSYILKNNFKAKNITIRIKNDGCVYVTKPRFVNIKQVEDFIYFKKDWIQKNIDNIKQNNLKNNFHESISKVDYLKYKMLANKIVIDKINLYNKYYNFKYNKISIKNQKTRWGSCSKKGNLNFNYKISMIPEYLAEYIVVHELCHLKEFNHGKGFWKLISETIPDYKNRVKDLKRIYLSNINIV